MIKDLKPRITNAVSWELLRLVTMQPLSFAFGIFLARVLSPSELGVMGLTVLFFNLATLLKDCGFSAALLRKTDRSDEDICTVFWTQMMLSAVLSLSLFLLAPIFAAFFKNDDLILLTRLSAFMMFISSIGAVHVTLYSARLDFKTPLIISVVVNLVSMLVTGSLAFMGFSFWSIMISNMVSGVLNLILIVSFSTWRPRFIFSKSSFKEFFSFGSSLALRGIIDIGFNDIRALIIGKFYSTRELALYSRSIKVAYLIPSIQDGLIGKLAYPIWSHLKDNVEKFHDYYRKYVQCCLILPIWGVLLVAALSTPLVRFLYGEQWVGCAPYVQMFCLSCVLYAPTILNTNVMLARGHSVVELKLQLIYKMTGITLLCIAAPISVYAITVSIALNGVIARVVNSVVVANRLNVSLREQARILLPYYLIATLANMPALLLSYMNMDDLSTLLIGGSISMVIYWGVMYMSRNAGLVDILSLIKQFYSDRRAKLRES